jgi:hypothetical protein
MRLLTQVNNLIKGKRKKFMSIHKEIINTPEEKNKIPQFQVILEEKFKIWTKINDPETGDAIKDLCGSLFFEMRKMTAQICRVIESKKLDDKVQKQIVEESKAIIDDTWKCIIDKQKVGIDKLGIIVRKYVKD